MSQRRSVLMAFLCFLLVGSAFAGQLQFPKKAGKKDRTSVEYDKFKDKTRVEMAWISVAPGDQVIMSASFSYQGQQPPKEIDNLSLHFACDGTPASGPNRSVEVRVIIDGQRKKLGDAQYLSTRVDRSISQSFFLPITAAEFRALAGAKKLEMQFGGVDLTITDKNQETIRNFAAYLPDGP